jgi:hypothetical protein
MRTIAVPDRSPGWWPAPRLPSAAAAVLEAAHERSAAWGVARTYGWDTGLPVLLWGVPDARPHVADADAAAGAGCFCQRFGWDVLVPETHGWRREPPRAANGTPSGREP